MSSLFDIPAQLAVLLSLAAATAGQEPAAASRPLTGQDANVAIEPLAGPMRFGERAWLRALQENGAHAGEFASRVFVTSGGRYYVPTASDRRRILDARHDAAFAGRIARAAAERNAARIRAVIKREPTAGDLYIAHVFGPEAAVALLRAASETPDAALKARFPALAGAAGELERAPGAPITVGRFYRKLAGALREPPRLVAIGLRPSVADAPDDGAARKEHPMLAWQVQVAVDKAAAPQPAQ